MFPAMIREKWTPLVQDQRALAGLVHLAAIGSSLALVVMGGGGPGWPATLIILLGFGVLRTITATSVLAVSTIILEPVGVAVFLAGTGGPASPFFPVALAGIWWAGRVRTGTPSRVYRLNREGRTTRIRLAAFVESPAARSAWLIYASSFAISYVALALPPAMRAGSAALVLRDVAVVVATSLLTGLARQHVTALQPTPVPDLPALDPEQKAIRDSLARTLRTVDIPMDGVLAAARVGLTARQAEMVAYLMLGLSNLEIADAVQVSEATVRYRLTSLYRTLGVKGRRQAAERARELGLTATPRIREQSQPA